MNDFTGLWYDCENSYTITSEEQCECEHECAKFLKSFHTYPKESISSFINDELINYNYEIKLLRSKHAMYLIAGLQKLSSGFVTLDASRPWICYWIMHALYLLNREPYYLYPRVISTLQHMQNTTGGFGGGPCQITHCAPNYAAVLALCTIGTEQALQIINRSAMYQYFLSLKHSSGGFCIHYDGEVDSRGTFTVIAIARILNILTDELTNGVAEFLLSCQTYEGGFGGEPWNEAHGGYNFCAVAALLILQQAHNCNLLALEHWLLQRQVKLEGGFQGRTNKLVDSCYSFWQGSALAIVQIIKNNGSDIYDLEQYLLHQNTSMCLLSTTTPSTDSYTGTTTTTTTTTTNNNNNTITNTSINSNKNTTKTTTANNAVTITNELYDEEVIIVEDSKRIKSVNDLSGCLSFNQHALQRYILHCAQNVEGGGMRDKPGKARDFYHSCYALSGLSVAQNCIVSSIMQHNLRNSSSTRNNNTSNNNNNTSNNNNSNNNNTSNNNSNSNNNYKKSFDEEVHLPDIDIDWTGAQVYGDIDNLLEPTSAVFNIGLKKLKFALEYFYALPGDHKQLIKAL